MANNSKRVFVAAFVVLMSCMSGAYAALTPEQTQQQNAQVVALSAATQVFVHRGEGREQAKVAQADTDLQQLRSNLQGLPAAHAAPAQQALSAYEQQVRDALAYDPSSPDLPWDFNLNFSNALAALLQGLQQSGAVVQQNPALSPEQALLWDLPTRFQYLAARYTARAYVGDLEPLSEDTASFLAQDLDQQTKALDQDLTALANALAARPEATQRVRDMQMRWRFIHGRLLNYDEDMAPLMVERSCAEIVSQLQALQQSL
ncbi:hypothetical protein [Atopomonas sediminilitoris]|uniref:hypothetical protein n=1 Tax=Atopomonas sediminilitoris TaxID=2919919 RepID=UPI001F4EB131|nr:hypothetical protein [Atopomonas sediminilitoris]MCJ8168954.1 hypothetical protein [Atopomonas sediminilitoris]